jgi:hypothetical protein
VEDGPSISYNDFRRACARHRPSELLPFLGRYSAETHGLADLQSQRLRSLPPWNFATVARECLLWGKEIPGYRVNQRAVARLFNMLRDVTQYGDDPTLAEIVTPIMHDQFPYQGNPYTDTGRAIAILATGWDEFPEWDWTPVFGMSLPQMVRATGVLQGLASMRGRIDLESTWDARIGEELAPREDLERALAYLTRTPEQHRANAAKAGVLRETAGQYDYNPLRSHPLVDFGPGTGIIAPEPRLVWHAISMQNLYYVGPTVFGVTKFHEQLGKRIESYVGRQLRLIDQADVTGEVSLDAQNKMSIDWFLVLPDLIVLIECKSARLNAKALAGDTGDMTRTTEMHLEKARRQIDATARKVLQRDERVRFLPDDDRPVVGLIVVAEAIWLANSGVPEYGSQGATPTMVLSLAELEGLVCLPTAELSSRLITTFTNEERRGWSFTQAFGPGLHAQNNPIIRKAGARAQFLRESN